MVAALIMTVSAPTGAARAATSADVRAALMAVDARFSAEVAAKGFAAFEGFFAEDAVFLPTFEPRVEGKAAIMESFRPLFNDRSIKLTWTPLRADVAQSGDLGWTTGSYEMTRIDGGGKPQVRRGKYVTIWRRQPDGSWKAVLDGGNPDSPPAPPQATATTQAPAPPGSARP